VATFVVTGGRVRFEPRGPLFGDAVQEVSSAGYRHKLNWLANYRDVALEEGRLLVSGEQQTDGLSRGEKIGSMETLSREEE
jgi:hypothetical protein